MTTERKWGHMTRGGIDYALTDQTEEEAKEHACCGCAFSRGPTMCDLLDADDCENIDSNGKVWKAVIDE